MWKTPFDQWEGLLQSVSVVKRRSGASRSTAHGPSAEPAEGAGAGAEAAGSAWPEAARARRRIE